MENQEQRVTTAYAKLALREPFIAAVMTRVKREVSDYEGRVPTAATDGNTVWFNPDFIANLNDNELFGVVIHEALHVVLMHMWRRGSRDPKLWNIANDAIINRYIKTKSYSLPERHVSIDWVTHDMDSEVVYERLKQQSNSDEMGSGGFDDSGDLIDSPSPERQADMEATITAAAQMAKAAGVKSSIVDLVLKNVGVSKVDWRNEMRSMLTAACPDDYTLRRPSRRFISANLYLPSLYSESLGGVAILIDVSCSMSDKELQQISCEAHQIFEDLRPSFVYVVYCNTEVVGVQRFEQGEDLVLSASGRGGTRFKPAFDALNDVENIVGAVYFTDMEGDLKECVAPNFPVIWGFTGVGTPPKPSFGVVAHVKQ